MNDNAGKFLRAPQQLDQSKSYDIDLTDLFAILWRGKWRVGFYALLAVVLGFVYAFYVATPIYSASTSIALESRQTQFADVNDVLSGLPSDQANVNTEVQVLQSRRLIEKLVVDLELVNDPEFNKTLRPDPLLSLDTINDLVSNLLSLPSQAPLVLGPDVILDDVIDEVLDRLTVANVRQSYVFVITARTEDPEKSARLTDRLAELYIEDQIVVKYEKTEEATAWLTERVGTLQIELESAETALENFSRNSDLISSEGLGGLNRQLKDLRTRREDVSDELSQIDGRLLALRAALSSGDTAKLADIVNDLALTRLLESEDASEARVQQRIGQLTQQAEQDRARLLQQEASIATSIRQLTQSIDTQAEEFLTLQQLQREAEASRLIYEFFLARLKETSVQQGTQQAESRIISYAVTPLAPIAPRKPVVLIMALLMGLLVAAADVLRREYTQSTYRLAADLEAKTGYPVLGQIPQIAARRRKKVLTYLRDKPNSAAAEAVRNLRTSLLLSDIDNPPRVIMSTSSIPGEGKTTQSIALAQNLAGLGKKILLLEGDIRRRVFAEYFDIADKPGFLKVLLGDVKLEDATTHLPEFDIDVLLGEKSTSNAADIFSSDRFTQFINMLRDKYDYVIIDTPPVLAVTDARIIGRAADAIIYSVKWDSTSHRQVADGLRSLEQVNLRVSGLVLGQIQSRGMKRYGYGDSVESYQAYYDH